MDPVVEKQIQAVIDTLEQAKLAKTEIKIVIATYDKEEFSELRRGEDYEKFKREERAFAEGLASHGLLGRIIFQPITAAGYYQYLADHKDLKPGEASRAAYAASLANGKEKEVTSADLDLKKEMSNAIQIIMTEVNEWDMTREEKRTLALAKKGNAGALCDLLTSLGMESDPRFDGFFYALDLEPEESDPDPAEDEKAILTSKIEDIMQEYARSFIAPNVSTDKMPQSEFSAIVKKWQLSTGFLQIFLGRSAEAVKSYKYRKDHTIPADAATKLRRLDVILDSMQQQRS